MLLYFAQYAWSMAPGVADMPCNACADYVEAVSSALIKMSIFLSFAGTVGKGRDVCM